MFRTIKMWQTLLVLALLCVGLTSRPAAAQLGGSLSATGGPASIKVQSNTTIFLSELWLKNPVAGQLDLLLATNRQVGTTVALPTYAAGTPLVFYIKVTRWDLNRIDTFHMGDGTANPDSIPHAVVTVVGPGKATVGFEDLLGGGDRDYDDNVFLFEGVSGGTPPVIGPCSVTPGVLWPANHKMVNVFVDYTVTDDKPGVTTVLTVKSNEPDNGLGDGDTAGDIEVIDAHHVSLRAERSGTGTGRVYTITITATDSDGNVVSEDHCTVSVPHDQGK